MILLYDYIDIAVLSILRSMLLFLLILSLSLSPWSHLIMITIYDIDDDHNNDAHNNDYDVHNNDNDDHNNDNDDHDVIMYRH